MGKLLIQWEFVIDKWQLLVRHGRQIRTVATVYPNGTWFTWDKNGTGGENASGATVGEAKVDAAGCAIRQGFI